MNHEAELFAFTFNITLNGQAAGLQIVSRRASAVVLSGKGFLKFFLQSVKDSQMVIILP